MVDARRTWGFKMADRCLGLDYDHCRLVVGEVAKFHALNWNYAMKKELKSLKEDIPFATESIFCEDQAELLRGMMGLHFNLMTQALEDSLGVESEVYKGLLRFKEDPVQCMLMYLKEDGNLEEEDIVRFLRIKPNPSEDPDWSKHDQCTLLYFTRVTACLYVWHMHISVQLRFYSYVLQGRTYGQLQIKCRILMLLLNQKFHSFEWCTWFSCKLSHIC